MQSITSGSKTTLEGYTVIFLTTVLIYSLCLAEDFNIITLKHNLKYRELKSFSNMASYGYLDISFYLYLLLMLNILQCAGAPNTPDKPAAATTNALSTGEPIISGMTGGIIAGVLVLLILITTMLACIMKKRRSHESTNDLLEAVSDGNITPVAVQISTATRPATTKPPKTVIYENLITLMSKDTSATLKPFRKTTKDKYPEPPMELAIVDVATMVNATTTPQPTVSNISSATESTTSKHPRTVIYENKITVMSEDPSAILKSNTKTTKDKYPEPSMESCIVDVATTVNAATTLTNLPSSHQPTISNISSATESTTSKHPKTVTHENNITVMSKDTSATLKSDTKTTKDKYPEPSMESCIVDVATTVNSATALTSSPSSHQPATSNISSATESSTSKHPKTVIYEKNITVISEDHAASLESYTKTINDKYPEPSIESCNVDVATTVNPVTTLASLPSSHQAIVSNISSATESTTSKHPKKVIYENNNTMMSKYPSATIKPYTKTTEDKYPEPSMESCIVDVATTVNAASTLTSLPSSHQPTISNISSATESTTSKYPKTVIYESNITVMSEDPSAILKSDTKTTKDKYLELSMESCIVDVPATVNAATKLTSLPSSHQATVSNISSATESTTSRHPKTVIYENNITVMSKYPSATLKSDTKTTKDKYPEPSMELSEPDNRSHVVVALKSYSGSNKNYLEFGKNDRMVITNKDDPDWWYAEHLTTHQKGFIPREWVADEDSNDGYEWFHKTDRSGCRRLLLSENCPVGTFMVRKNERNGEFVLSIKVSMGEETDSLDKARIIHYKINQFNYRYCISSRLPNESNLDTFKSLLELVQYYQGSNHLACRLQEPCSKEPIHLPLYPKLRDRFEVSHDEFQVIGDKPLESGQFGEVWKGVRKNWGVEVAIKKFGEGEPDVEQFSKEAAMMKQCNHKNIVKLHAICTQSTPYYIVTEFVVNGDLRGYLKKTINISSSTLINIAVQVASGMDYLSKIPLIHRDLTARNILVGTQGLVKVAGFGMARLLTESEYCSQKNHAKPVRWTAPEALTQNIYSCKSDVWSFGILLVEIITRGQTPYPNLTGLEEVCRYVDSGSKHECPAECLQSLYEIMLTCWAYEAENRPDFSALLDRLEEYESHPDIADDGYTRMR